MFTKVTTLTEFIIKQERQFKKATGSFTLLLTAIENATKIIASHVKKTGLVDIIGVTGEKNIYQEEVQKLDRFSNDLLVDTLVESGQVYAVASEELVEPIFVKKHPGEYVVFIDPLDGSSNIDANISIGTIFSIYHKSENILQPGLKQVAAGYVIYGSSVMFVYSCGGAVNGFTLDPSIGSFLLSHPNMKVPLSGNIYSINEGYEKIHPEYIKKYLKVLKNGKKVYKGRFVGSMVADIHRTLLKGGIFLYPEDAKHPQGKLRLMFEVNPLAYIMEKAGGMALSGTKSPLEIIPHKVDQRAPIVMGSKEEVEKFNQTNPTNK